MDYHKKYYLKNKEHMKDYSRKYYNKNRNHYNQINKEVAKIN